MRLTLAVGGCSDAAVNASGTAHTAQPAPKPGRTSWWILAGSKRGRPWTSELFGHTEPPRRHRRPEPRCAGSRAYQENALFRRIQVGILADFKLHLGAFFFVMHEHHAIAEVFAFDATLRFAKQPRHGVKGSRLRLA